MTRYARGVLLCVFSAFLLRLWHAGELTSFVHPKMTVLVAICGVVAGILGLTDAFAGTTGEGNAAPKVALLLIAPVVVYAAASPTSLGAAAAARARPLDAAALAGTTARTSIDDLDPDVATHIPMLDFVTLAWNEPADKLAGIPVTVDGFVVNNPDVPGGFLLTRFVVSCCAADGTPVHVAVVNGGTFDNDTWVRATVRWDGNEDDQFGTIHVTADDVAPIDRPADPYESAW